MKTRSSTRKRTARNDNSSQTAPNKVRRDTTVSPKTWITAQAPNSGAATLPPELVVRFMPSCYTAFGDLMRTAIRTNQAERFHDKMLNMHDTTGRTFLRLAKACFQPDFDFARHFTTEEIASAKEARDLFSQLYDKRFLDKKESHKDLEDAIRRVIRESLRTAKITRSAESRSAQLHATRDQDVRADSSSNDDQSQAPEYFPSHDETDSVIEILSENEPIRISESVGGDRIQVNLGTICIMRDCSNQRLVVAQFPSGEIFMIEADRIRRTIRLGEGVIVASRVEFDILEASRIQHLAPISISDKGEVYSNSENHHKKALEKDDIRDIIGAILFFQRFEEKIYGGDHVPRQLVAMRHNPSMRIRKKGENTDIFSMAFKSGGEGIESLAKHLVAEYNSEYEK